MGGRLALNKPSLESELALKSAVSKSAISKGAILIRFEGRESWPSRAFSQLAFGG